MFENLIKILLAIGLVKSSFQRNLDVDTLMNIENILRSVDENNDDRDDDQSVQGRNDEALDRNLRDDDDRIDIDSLDSLIKRIANDNDNNQFNDNDNNQFNDDDFDRFLRNANEKLCNKVGRCGCGQPGGRCGKTSLSNQQTVDEIQRLINDLEDRIDRDDERDTNDRDNKHENDNAGNRDKDHLNVVREEDDDANEERYVNKLDDDSHSPNNRLDLVIVNDLTNLGDSFTQNDLINLDKLASLEEQNIGKIKHRSGRNKNKDNNVKAIIVDLGRFYNESGLIGGNSELQRSDSDSREFSNPDEFLQNFNKLKEKVTEKIVNFITHADAKKPNLSVLSNTQKRKIRILKGKMRTNKENMTKQELKHEVNDILFGKNSLIKVVPSEDNSNKITVPKWLYKLIASTRPKPLRSPKRILPLTHKQQKKLYTINLNQSQGPVISKVWRRSLGQNLEKFGVPFELAVQGLAQYNDE